MKKAISRLLSIILGVAVAVLFSIPFIVFRDEIKELGGWGYLGVFVACILTNMSMFIPASSTIVVLVAASTLNPILCIIAGAIGTSIGEQTAYLCGKIGRMTIENNDTNNKLVIRIRENPFLLIVLFAMLPLPIFDFVGVVAGVTDVKWSKYALAATVGKTIKYIYAYVGLYFLLPRLMDYMPIWERDLIEKYLQYLR